jgi:hypothetical protein
MTKHFSNQRRENMRPSSRNASSGRYREEQSFKPGRPRLSRDTVDRAWENGATRTYADYRPRQNAQTPPARRQGRPSPAFNRSESPQNRRPYEPRQQSYRGQSSDFRGGYQQRYEQSPEAGSRHFNQGGQRAPAERPGFNSERWTRNPAPRQREYTGRYQDERPPRFGQDRYPPARPGARPERGPRSFERVDRERESFARGRRPAGPRAGRDNSNPRWQSRPAARRTYQTRPEYPPARREYPASQQAYPYDRPEAEQFEGDYERFDSYEQAEWEEQPENRYEKHVTRLPDGRVLKGSRPSQRKQARFWNGVEEETESLMPKITPIQSIQEVPPGQEKPATKKPRTRKQAESTAPKVKTVKTTHARDAGPRASKEKVGKDKGRAPQGPVTRPSQRGYKWPTAGQG